MFASALGYVVRAALGASAAAMILVMLSTGPTQAATVDEFLANPAAVMAQYPDGGADLISLIRDVATSHPEALSTITSLLSSGSADQQAAVGSGLGQAYTQIQSSDPNYAAQIQAAVAGSASTNAQTAYSGATGNVSTASTSGPGAGGGAGAGGGGGGGSGGPAGGSGSAGNAPSGGSNSGSGGTSNSGSSQTSSGTFTGGGGSVGGTTSASGSVSPRG